MRELTVREYAEEQGISVNSAYKRVRSNKVRSKEKMVENKMITLVLLDDFQEQDNSSIESNIKPEEQNLLLQRAVDHTPELLDFMDKITIQLTQYAELAGQTKLLTDSENRTRQEYFQLIQESKHAEQERAELRAKNQLLEKQVADREELKTRAQLLERDNQEYSKIIEENKSITQERYELMVKLEISHQRLRELEEQLNQKKQKKSLRKMFKEFVIKTF